MAARSVSQAYGDSSLLTDEGGTNSELDLRRAGPAAQAAIPDGRAEVAGNTVLVRLVSCGSPPPLFADAVTRLDIEQIDLLGPTSSNCRSQAQRIPRFHGAKEDDNEGQGATTLEATKEIAHEVAAHL